MTLRSRLKPLPFKSHLSQMVSDAFSSYIGIMKLGSGFRNTPTAGRPIDFLPPENLIWIVVGDRNEIESRVRELELGEFSSLDQDGNEI